MSRIQDSLLLSEFVKLALRLAADSWYSIVLIHGLQGHPYKTWARKVSCRDMPLAASSSFETPGVHDGSRKYHRVVPELPDMSSGPSKTGHNSSQEGYGKSKGGVDVKRNKVFWPKDLLPIQCPKARILVYGYDTKVTNYLSGPTNETSIHSHGKDLLSSLAAFRKLNSRLILIAHSLGGIVVKEMLASSSSSSEDRLRNVVASTSAVIFLGTPHRGSPDPASLGDQARSLISFFRVRTNPAILDALRLKTKDLERAQESFSAVWNQNDFRVKTFKEGLGLTGLNFGPLGKKVVSDESSLLGDVRERAETIQANHMDMCRFTGLDDPNYNRICGEITDIYESLARLMVTTAHPIDKHSSIATRLAVKPYETRLEGEDEREKICLQQSLFFPNMNQRAQNLDSPAEGTCSWFFKHEAFADWLSHKNQSQSCGLLWLRGKPGSGKSTLLKEAFSRAATDMKGRECHVMSFFFNAKGEDLEHSPIGMLRSILHQMCSQSPEILGELLDIAQKRRALHGEDMAPWQEAELKASFKSAIIGQKKRAIIFIDAIDECDSNYARDVADFWRETTKATHHAGVQLSVCLSSRHYPAMNVNNCPEIIMENHNYPDIVKFVGRRLDLAMSGSLEDRKAIQQKILDKSGGVFLWVSLVLKDVLRKNHEGKGLRRLLKDLDSVPQELGHLFRELLTAVPCSKMIVKMFQWALLTDKPRRLHEWHHILAFIEDNPPSSLRQWRQSEVYTETDEQLEKRITYLSRGLLGFNISSSNDNDYESANESMSDRAGAGSLDVTTGETRVAQVIHESVRQYFMEGPGFAELNPALGANPVGHGHLSVMNVCLDYILIAELDAFADARGWARRYQCATGSIWKCHKLKPIVSTPASSYTTSFTTNSYSSEFSMSSRSAFVAPQTNIPSETDQSIPRSRHDSSASIASFGSASNHEGSQRSLAFELEGNLGDAWIENDRRRGRPRLNESPSQAAPRWRSKGDSVSVYERSKGSPGPFQAYNVASWMSQGIPATDQVCHDEAVAFESPQTSVAGCSQVLEDYPALLSYATLEVFTHAQKADAENLDPTHIIQLFQSNGCWRRWRALREDMDQFPGLLDLVADLGLFSWLKVGGVWSNTEVVRSMKWAIEYNHTRALYNLLDAFPSIGYGRVGGSLARLSANATDVAALRAYISQHPSETPNSTNKIKALKEILGSKGETGRTALHFAVLQQNKAAVSLLLKHGADVSAIDLKLRTPLHIACMPKSRWTMGPVSDIRVGADMLTPRLDIIESLLDHDAEIDAVDEQGRTPLMMACSDNASPPPGEMCEGYASTESQSKGGCFSAVELLLKRGANATKGGIGNFLPLHEACRNSLGGRQSKVFIVSRLLDYGSPVNAATDRGVTPLQLACSCPDHHLVKGLLRRGANPLSRDHQGRSPVHIAIAESTERVIDALLLLPRTWVDALDEIGSTPLHVACDYFIGLLLRDKSMRLASIRRMIAHRVKTYWLRDQHGHSPADVARQHNLEEALELMEGESCDISARESSDRNDQCD